MKMDALKRMEGIILIMGFAFVAENRRRHKIQVDNNIIINN